MNFIIVLVLQNVVEFLMEISLSLWITFDDTDISIILILLTPEHEGSFRQFFFEDIMNGIIVS